jgi:hypothetical protein
LAAHFCGRIQILVTDIFGDCEMLSLHRADFTRLLQPHYAKELQKRCALLERTFAFEVMRLAVLRSPMRRPWLPALR